MANTSTLVTGGTGFVGRKLIPRLSQPLICSRNAERARQSLAGLSDQLQVLQWQPKNGPIQIPADQKVGQVVNLMGESIAEGRWTEAKKQRIRDSRVAGTRNLVDGLLASNNLPDTFVSASAIGFYGDSGEAIVEEGHQPGTGFLPDVCQEWETEALRLEQHGVRVVCLRIGIVIGAEGGAIKEMLPIFKWGIGGRLGSGNQWMAWIHVDDLVGLIEHCLQEPSLSGPVNATAPNPVRNREFTKALASAVNRPAFLPAPKFAIRLALGEFANSLFFSQRVVPEAALASGFHFRFDQIAAALDDVV